MRGYGNVIVIVMFLGLSWSSLSYEFYYCFYFDVVLFLFWGGVLGGFCWQLLQVQGIEFEGGGLCRVVVLVWEVVGREVRGGVFYCEGECVEVLQIVVEEVCSGKLWRFCFLFYSLERDFVFLVVIVYGVLIIRVIGQFLYLFLFKFRNDENRF